PSAYGATAGEGKTQAKGTVLEARKITPLPHIAGGKVPAALSAVVMKALTLDKTKRYQSVAEFSTDVEAYQGGFATIAEQAGLAKQLALLIKRHKGIFITATAAWLLISGLAVWFVLNLRTKEQRATQAEALAVLREGETSKALGRSAISLTEAALREGNGFAMQAALKEVPENLRDSTWHYLLGQSDTSIARIDWGTQIDSAVAHPHLPSVFAVVDHGGKVTLLNVRTGERFLEFDSGFPQEGWCVWYRIAMSSDGERIAVGRRASAESNLRIFGARDGKQVLSCDGGGFTWQLEFSPDGKMLLEHQYRENSSNRLNFWSVSTGKVIRSHDIGGGGTVSVFTPDGQAVLVQSRKQPPRLVGVWNDSLSRRFECPAAQTAALRPDGRLIVTGDMSGMVRGVDVADGSVVFETRSAANLIDHIIFHPDGTRFATISTISEGRQVIQLWDSQTGGPLQALLGGSGAAMGAAAHPLSGELLVCGPDSRVWDLSFARWTLHSDRSARIAFFGDDNVVFAPAKLADACLQQLQDRDVVNLMESSAASAFANVSVSADGRVVAGETKWTSSGVEFIVQRRDAGGIKQVGAFKPLYGAEVLRLNPKGERAAIVHGQSAGFAVYLTANGQTLNGWESRDFRRFNDIEWLSNEHLLGLVTARADRGSPGSEELVVIWDMATGKILRSAAQLEVMDVLAVSPDGLRFAEAGADKKVRIRDAATLAVLKEFRAHDGPITALAWHPKKPILASGSADLTLRLWNLETGARIDELRGPLAVPHTLAFAPSGQRLGCASLDATTRIWDPPSLRDKTSTPQKVGSDARDERVWFKKPPPKKPKAAPPKDIEGWEDLLASFSREEVERTGRGWSLKDGELFSPAKVGHVALALPGNLMGT
ncbi:MAG: hypothetical protein JNG86_11685, partial [Verrucomicrobiaceae bacterium]|nr:hypothetical protein [Verrucomicrobiaceae bacterium]